MFTNSSEILFQIKVLIILSCFLHSSFVICNSYDDKNAKNEVQNTIENKKLTNVYSLLEKYLKEIISSRKFQNNVLLPSRQYPGVFYQPIEKINRYNPIKLQARQMTSLNRREQPVLKRKDSFNNSSNSKFGEGSSNFSSTTTERPKVPSSAPVSAVFASGILKHLPDKTQNSNSESAYDPVPTPFSTTYSNLSNLNLNLPLPSSKNDSSLSYASVFTPLSTNNPNFKYLPQSETNTDTSFSHVSSTISRNKPNLSHGSLPITSTFNNPYLSRRSVHVPSLEIQGKGNNNIFSYVSTPTLPLTDKPNLFYDPPHITSEIKPSLSYAQVPASSLLKNKNLLHFPVCEPSLVNNLNLINATVPSCSIANYACPSCAPNGVHALYHIITWLLVPTTSSVSNKKSLYSSVYLPLSVNNPNLSHDSVSVLRGISNRNPSQCFSPDKLCSLALYGK